MGWHSSITIFANSSIYWNDILYDSISHRKKNQYEKNCRNFSAFIARHYLFLFEIQSRRWNDVQCYGRLIDVELLSSTTWKL